MAHADRILTGFLRHQYEEGMALSAASDLFALVPIGPRGAAAMYLAEFRCRGLILRNDEVVEHNNFVIGIHFPDDYLRCFDTARVLTLCEPAETFHPNINAPLVCAGHMLPGTPLVELLHQVFEVVTFQNVDMREPNALNRRACSWARRNQHRFPLDRRPLKRRRPVHSP